MRVVNLFYVGYTGTDYKILSVQSRRRDEPRLNRANNSALSFLYDRRGAAVRPT